MKYLLLFILLCAQNLCAADVDPGHDDPSCYSCWTCSYFNYMSGVRAKALCACCNSISGRDAEAECSCFNRVHGDDAAVTCFACCNDGSGNGSLIFTSWGTCALGENSTVGCSWCNSIDGIQSHSCLTCCNFVATDKTTVDFPACFIISKNADEEQVCLCCYVHTGSRCMPCCCAASVGRHELYESYRKMRNKPLQHAMHDLLE